MNLYYAGTEGAITTFTSYLSDAPLPEDQRYDRVLPSFAMTNLLVPVVVGTNTFANGLVFDSRITPSMTNISPVVSTDSGVNGMQHMGVVKDFHITYSVTNLVLTVPPLVLIIQSINVIR